MRFWRLRENATRERVSCTPAPQRFGGMVFALGYDKSLTEAVLGMEARLGGESTDVRCHQLFREELL